MDGPWEFWQKSSSGQSTAGSSQEESMFVFKITIFPSYSHLFHHVVLEAAMAQTGGCSLFSETHYQFPISSATCGFRITLLTNVSIFLHENLNYVTLNLAHLCDGVVPMFFRYYFYYVCVAIKSLKANSRPGPVPVKLSQPLMFGEKQQKQDPMDKSLYWPPADAASAVFYFGHGPEYLCQTKIVPLRRSCVA